MWLLNERAWCPVVPYLPHQAVSSGPRGDLLLVCAIALPSDGLWRPSGFRGSESNVALSCDAFDASDLRTTHRSPRGWRRHRILSTMTIGARCPSAGPAVARRAPSSASRVSADSPNSPTGPPRALSESTSGRCRSPPPGVVGVRRRALSGSAAGRRRGPPPGVVGVRRRALSGSAAGRCRGPPPGVVGVRRRASSGSAAGRCRGPPPGVVGVRRRALSASICARFLRSGLGRFQGWGIRGFFPPRGRVEGGEATLSVHEPGRNVRSDAA